MPRARRGRASSHATAASRSLQSGATKTMFADPAAECSVGQAARTQGAGYADSEGGFSRGPRSIGVRGRPRLGECLVCCLALLALLSLLLSLLLFLLLLRVGESLRGLMVLADERREEKAERKVRRDGEEDEDRDEEDEDDDDDDKGGGESGASGSRV